MDYDYIVVGGGSAGCVAAARLVNDFDARVLLLEAGWPDTDPLVHMPAGFVRMLVRGSRQFTRYATEMQPALHGRSVPFLQANVLGGGSSVNAMTYARGTRADYDRWNDHIGGGWGWDDILPHFVRQEGNQRLGAPHHGVSGPLKVSDAAHPPSDLSRAFALTLQQMGVAYTPDINSGNERGVTYIQSTTFRGRRCSAAGAFIHPLRHHTRLTVKHRSCVTRIIFDGKRAVGVEYGAVGRRGTQVAHAGAEVILAAGSLISPKLLMLSGIGPAAALRKHGIPILVDLPGVGQNLQDHNDTSLAFHTSGNFGYSGEDRGLRLWVNGLQYLLFGSGPVASTGSEVTAFVNPDAPAAAPNIQFYCIGTILSAVDGVDPRVPGGMLIANLVAPTSRGEVRLRSADPAAPPIIDPNWLTTPEDVAALVSGLKYLREVAATKPFSDLVTGVVAPRPTLAADADLADYCRRVTGTNWHPVGTCRMGADSDPTAVLDAALRVRGVQQLRVFDGSMMPSIVSANTNAPIMAVADRGVDLMMRTAAVRPIGAAGHGVDVIDLAKRQTKIPTAAPHEA